MTRENGKPDADGDDHRQRLRGDGHLIAIQAGLPSNEEIDAGRMVKMAQHAARIILPSELIAQLLSLPDNVTVVGAEWHPLTQQLTLRVNGPDLPFVPEGAVPPIRTLEEIGAGERQ